jgi:sulfite exporter TauE/SafE
MWFTALVIGFTGSLHCVAMCSPLAMAVSRATPPALMNRLLYNGGRVMVYGLLGALVSTVGRILPVHEFQNLFSLAMGCILILVGLSGVEKIRIPGVAAVLRRFTDLLKMTFAAQLKNKSKLSIALLGALNGLLPCGLTSVALVWCLTLRGPVDGFNFMLLFGAGTLPAMIGLTGVINWAADKQKWSIQTLTTTLLILSGCALIVRVFVITFPAQSFTGVTDILCR